MYNTIKDHHLTGTHGVPQRPVQGVPTGQPPYRDKADEGIVKKNGLLPDVNVWPIAMNDISEKYSGDRLRQLAGLMVEVTRKFTGSIDSWRFDERDSLQDLILRCANRLRDRARVDLIDVYRNCDGELELDLKRYIGDKGNIYCINLKPLYGMKCKNRKLFDILLSFIKGLPFDSIFDTCEDRIDWIWTFLIEEMAYCREAPNEDYGERLKGSVDFLSRYERKYNDFQIMDWKSRLEGYRPQKDVYRKLKELLLASEKLDFQVVQRVSVRDGYESMFDFYHTFLITDDDESEFTRSYINMLNDCSNEYDLLSTYAHATVSNNGMEVFEEGLEEKLKEVENFICEFNELIEQI
ncbi:hypothetical protein AB1A65_16110 [Muricauda sp. ANG21]|uniref:hypothetical protein n=1 Tax=Allomuricauda sp. ANG21 TaxID=3042468 RepID=UPI0034559586